MLSSAIAIGITLLPANIGYVVRLPCKYEARFLIKENFTYGGDALKAFPGITRENCSLRCTIMDVCAFFTYSYEQLLCVMFSSEGYPVINNSKLQPKVNWAFGATEYNTLLVSQLDNFSHVIKIILPDVLKWGTS